MTKWATVALATACALTTLAAPTAAAAYISSNISAASFAVDFNIRLAAEMILEHRGADTKVINEHDVPSRIVEAFALEGRTESRGEVARKFRETMITAVSSADGSSSPVKATAVTTGEAYIEAAPRGASALTEMSESPEQLHLSLYDQEGSVVIMWTTSLLSNSSTACVWPGTADRKESAAAAAAAARTGKLSFSTTAAMKSGHEVLGGAAAAKVCVDGDAYTYHPISVLPWHGRLHRVFLPKGSLVPGQTYQYQVGDRVLQNWSHVVQFTAPDVKSVDRELFVSIGGDMGTIQVTGWQQAEQMLKFHQNVKPFDAFWLLGDISYSTLDPPRMNFEFFWDTFMRQEAPLVQHIPFLLTYGNHDFSGGDSGAFINRYSNPQGYSGGGGASPPLAPIVAPPPNNGNFYWSYTHGPVAFISMCTEIGINPKECEYLPGSPQYAWLEATLKAVDRTKTPWVVLGGHRPMYSSDNDTDSGPLQKVVEPLIVKYGVDVQVAGHMHAVELTSPVKFNTANMTGVVRLPSIPTGYGNRAASADGDRHGTSDQKGSFTGLKPLPLNYTNAVRYKMSRPSAPVHITIGMLGGLCEETFNYPAPKWSLFRNGTLFDDAEGIGALRATRTELEITVIRHITEEVMFQVLIQK